MKDALGHAPLKIKTLIYHPKLAVQQTVSPTAMGLLCLPYTMLYNDRMFSGLCSGAASDDESELGNVSTMVEAQSECRSSPGPLSTHGVLGSESGGSADSIAAEIAPGSSAASMDGYHTGEHQFYF